MPLGNAFVFADSSAGPRWTVLPDCTRRFCRAALDRWLCWMALGFCPGIFSLYCLLPDALSYSRLCVLSLCLWDISLRWVGRHTSFVPVGNTDVSPWFCVLCSQSSWNCSDERPGQASQRGPGGREVAQRVWWSLYSAPKLRKTGAALTVVGSGFILISDFQRIAWPYS